VPRLRLLADIAETFMPKSRAGSILLQTGLAIGLIRDCIAMIGKVEATLGHVNKHLPSQKEPIEDTLAALTDETRFLRATPFETDRDYI
jgi:hypothetical protein